MIIKVGSRVPYRVGSSFDGRRAARRALARAYITRTNRALILGIEEVNTLYHVTDIEHASTAVFEC